MVSLLLSANSKKNVLKNFFYELCPDCLSALPFINVSQQRVWAEHKDRGQMKKSEQIGKKTNTKRTF